MIAEDVQKQQREGKGRENSEKQKSTLGKGSHGEEMYGVLIIGLSAVTEQCLRLFKQLPLGEHPATGQ
jgi:hypothetical protein